MPTVGLTYSRRARRQEPGRPSQEADVMRPTLAQIVSAAVLVTALGLAGLAAVPEAAAVTADSGPQAACPAPAPGTAACTLISTASGTSASTGGPAAGLLGPADLQGAYGLQSLTGGMRQDIALVIPGLVPSNAESDLGTYRSNYSIPPCTAGDGCLTIKNLGATGTISSWPNEAAFDLDALSAVCPNCHLTVVEAADAAIPTLASAAASAAAIPGVHVVVNPFWTGEFSNETANDPFYNQPGVAMIAPAGNTGYGTSISYPAASPYVTAVGGTVLTKNTSAGLWSDSSAWPRTISGCSLYEAKPAWQHDTLCSGRTINDVSAAAAAVINGVTNDAPAAYVYNNTWAAGGGTSLAADIIAGTYALAGTPASNTPAAYPYQGNAYDLNDITAGSTGTGCAPAALCNAGTGYDGPTGLGTPSSPLDFTSNDSSTGPIYVGFTLCLDNRDGHLAIDNPIQAYSCNGGTNSQQWTLESDGTIRIGSGSSFCVGVSGGGTASNTPVILYTCDGHTSQQWQSAANGWLVNQNSGKCLYDPSGDVGGAQLVIYGCGANGDRGEWWMYIRPVPSSTGEIKYRSDSSLCIDIPSLSSNTRRQLLTCNGNSNRQIWTISSTSQLKIASSWCISLDAPDYSEIQKCGSNFAPQVIVITSNGALRNFWSIFKCMSKSGTYIASIGGDCTASANEWILP